MGRRTTQALFVGIGLGWLLFTAVDAFGYTFGDCASRECDLFRSAEVGLIFWRGLAVALMLVIAYRFFRKEPDA